MKTDEEMFALVRRMASNESQLVTRRSFLGETDAGGARSYQELQDLRRELDASLGYDPERLEAASGAIRSTT